MKKRIIIKEQLTHAGQDYVLEVYISDRQLTPVYLNGRMTLHKTETWTPIPQGALREAVVARVSELEGTFRPLLAKLGG